MEEPDAPTEVPACRNCGAELHGRFCAACGQDESRGRVSVPRLLAQVTDSLFDVDSTLWSAVRGLTRAPGHFAREYVDGKRAGRFTPFRYVLLTAAFSIVVNVNLFPHSVPRISEGPNQAAGIAAAAAFLVSYLALISVLGIPLAGVALRLTHHRARFNVAEACVLFAYATGQLSLLGLLLSPISFWSPAIYMAAGFALQFGFIAWSVKQFYERSWFVAAMTTGVALTAYYAVVMALSGVVVLVFAFVNRP